MVTWVTVFSVLDQSQALLPLRMMSLSLMLCGTETRKCCGSEYQTRIVCDPVSREAIEVGSEVPGSDGRPREEVSTTVPVSGGVGGLDASADSSLAGVLAGSEGAAEATEITDPASTPPTTITAPAGTAHRARLDIRASCFISPHPYGSRLYVYLLTCLISAVVTLRNFPREPEGRGG